MSVGWQRINLNKLKILFLMGKSRSTAETASFRNCTIQEICQTSLDYWIQVFFVLKARGFQQHFSFWLVWDLPAFFLQSCWKMHIYLCIYMLIKFVKCHFKIYMYAYVIYINVYMHVIYNMHICVLQRLKDTSNNFGHKEIWNTVGLPSIICPFQPGILDTFLLRSTLKWP